MIIYDDNFLLNNLQQGHLSDNAEIEVYMQYIAVHAMSFACRLVLEQTLRARKCRNLSRRNDGLHMHVFIARDHCMRLLQISAFMADY